MISHQSGERKFKWDRGEFRVASSFDAASGGVTVPLEMATRVHCAERGIIAEFGDVGISRALDVREPVARFGMDVDFVKRMAFNFVRVNPQDEMPVGGQGV